MDLAEANHLENLNLKRSDALIVVDLQNDFLPGGALATPEGDKIVPGVNDALKKFYSAHLPIVFTQDWHPEGHHSFASMHEDKNPFDPYEAHGLGPVLWPDHCVQGSYGADFAPGLETNYAQTIVRKAFNKEIDSYSAFLENDHQTETGMDGYLIGRGVKRVLICGLAFDYCVNFTAGDGIDKGYEVVVFTDLTQPVGSPPGSVEKTRKNLEDKGVQFAKSELLQRAEMA